MKTIYASLVCAFAILGVCSCSKNSSEMVRGEGVSDYKYVIVDKTSIPHNKIIEFGNSAMTLYLPNITVNDSEWVITCKKPSPEVRYSCLTDTVWIVDTIENIRVPHIRINDSTFSPSRHNILDLNSYWRSFYDEENQCLYLCYTLTDYDLMGIE